ncbi:aldo/keto reductase [Occallatibacter savannae]|uniref:aldo/keto reductase n=1 Tax=Occallatibacter savannae TaxID=1002691 RepID=UPI001EF59828|nr:aldo/keto reductase [Occallatibacter savannae]
MVKRRDFIAGAGAAAALMQSKRIEAAQMSEGNSAQSMNAESNSGQAAARIPRVTNAGTMKGEMLYRELGSTGEQVSVIGLGGSHLGRPKVEEDDAIRLIHEGLDRGINFLDNSWDYNEGRSEERVGKALSQGGYRQKAFVMTKLDGRTKEVATNQINDSLRRLKVDHIDLLQHHEVIRFDDPDRIFAEGGAMEAVVEARQAGKVRHIGFTGHKDPRIHLYMLEVAQKHGFHFDTVQMPVNIMDAHFRSFSQMVVPEAVKQKIGVLGMKSFGDGIILKSGAVQPMDCLHYSLNLPISVLITGIDSKMLLDQAFTAVKDFKPMDESAVAALIGKTEQVAMSGKYELFKTTSHFDTTARHPDWLGADTPAVQKLSPQLPG